MAFRIAVVGSGYVGLTVGVCFASRGFRVVCVDVDVERVRRIGRGEALFYEPKLDELLRDAVNRGLLSSTTDVAEAVADADFSFICVGTPSLPDGHVDLSQVRAAASAVGRALRDKSGYHVVVVKSTVVPGTTLGVVLPLLERESGKKLGNGFGLAVNPEFLSEGSAVDNFLHPDRIVIGGCDERSGNALEQLYRKFYGDDMPPVVRVSPSTAELIKYASNAFLAMKVSFINTIANICERTPGADVVDVARGIGLDRRIGRLFLRAGLGYGGPCFPKDIRALISYSKDVEYDPVLLEAVERVNDLQPFRAVELAKKLVGDLRGKRVAILGLSFKPNTSDMRDATSIKLVNKLLQEGAEVVVYDPVAVKEAKKIFGSSVVYAGSARECIHGADCCVVVTEWDEFRELKPEDFLREMRIPAVVDGRRIYDPEIFRGKLRFAAIGLGP